MKKRKSVTYYVGGAAFVLSGVNIGNVELWIRADAAIFVPCDYCKAEAGSLCVNPRTGRRTSSCHAWRKTRYRRLER